MLGLKEPVRALLLTFNQTLRGYVEELAGNENLGHEELDLRVETFGRWASGLLSWPDILQERAEILDPLVRGVGLGAGSDLTYFRDEVAYIRGRFHPDRREEYLTARRIGRGRAPAVPRGIRERLLSEVLPAYETTLEAKGVLDWEDVAVHAADAKGTPYDVVVVDECQDFAANQLRAVQRHLASNHMTTFVMDGIQTIYPHRFEWREIGIEMRPEMVTLLKTNYRNTKEIARFAASLVQGLPPDPEGAVPDPEACRRTGPRPVVLLGQFSWQFSAMLEAIQPVLDSGDSVAILHALGGGWFRFMKDRLQGQGIQYCEITRSRDWPTGPEQVALSTIHSVKGLEFDHVLIPGLNAEVTPHGAGEDHGTFEALRRLLAMGIGRARKSVMLGAKPGEQSKLFGFLDSESFELRKE